MWNVTTNNLHVFEQKEIDFFLLKHLVGEGSKSEQINVQYPHTA
jgi:hypothetical protein